MQDNETSANIAEATETMESSDNQTTATDGVTVAADHDETATATDNQTTATAEEPAEEEPVEEEEITYHAVQKDSSVTAIWEMQGRKHLRTIDPRSREGAEILRLFSAEEEAA